MGRLAQQTGLCRAAFADLYWKNQSHKRTGTLVILSDMPNVVCAHINDDFVKCFLKVGWLEGGSILFFYCSLWHCYKKKQKKAGQWTDFVIPYSLRHITFGFLHCSGINMHIQSP